MGYPRFGAVGALLLTRLCIGTSIESSELQLVLMVLLAEVVEVFWIAHCFSFFFDMPLMMAHCGQA